MTTITHAPQKTRRCIACSNTQYSATSQ